MKKSTKLTLFSLAVLMGTTSAVGLGYAKDGYADMHKKDGAGWGWHDDDGYRGRRDHDRGDRDGYGRGRHEERERGRYDGRRGSGGERGRMMLGLLDTNKDGEITMEESKEAVMNHFKKADTDGNGHLSAQEVGNAMEAMRAEQRGSRLVSRLDSDDDNEVSLDELMKHLDDGFSHFDRNDDGKINQDDRKKQKSFWNW